MTPDSVGMHHVGIDPTLGTTNTLPTANCDIMHPLRPRHERRRARIDELIAPLAGPTQPGEHPILNPWGPDYLDGYNHQYWVLQPETARLVIQSTGTHPSADAWIGESESTRTASGTIILEHDPSRIGPSPDAYTCNLCGRPFTARFSLYCHLLDDHDEKFVCLHCLRTFTRKFNLDSHMLAHDGHKAFSCSVCRRAFTRLSDCRAHERLHDKNEKSKFRCAGCPRAFGRKANLERHLRSNMGRRCRSKADNSDASEQESNSKDADGSSEASAYIVEDCEDRLNFSAEKMTPIVSLPDVSLLNAPTRDPGRTNESSGPCQDSIDVGNGIRLQQTHIGMSWCEVEARSYAFGELFTSSGLHDSTIRGL